VILAIVWALRHTHARVRVCVCVCVCDVKVNRMRVWSSTVNQSCQSLIVCCVCV